MKERERERKVYTNRPPAFQSTKRIEGRRKKLYTPFFLPLPHSAKEEERNALLK
jgi:hypothetical protein